MRVPSPYHRSRILLIWILLVLSFSAGCAHVSAAPEETPPTAKNKTAQTQSLTPTTQPTPQQRTPTPSRTTTRVPTQTPAPTSTPKPETTSTGRVIAPILMYHHVSDRGNTQYITGVRAFRAQMQALHDQGYQTVTISTLAAAIRGEETLPENPIVITFDDGYLDVFENAFPIMQEYGFTGVAYIITGTFEKSKSYGYMQVEQLRELIDAGWEIGSHSINHTNLKTTPAGFRSEVEGSKKVLEEKLDVQVRSFSYPFASANDWIKQQVEKYGYESAVGVGTFVSYTPKQLFFLSRREVYRGITTKDFLGLLIPTETELSTATP